MNNYQESVLLNVIKRYPNGIKEYDLLMLLKAEQPKQAQVALLDSLTLFKQHFLLFHSLYQLDDKLRIAKAGHLIIEALKIQWVPYHPKSNNQNIVCSIADKGLRDYYLDISHLDSTSSEDVENLLASFWVSMNADSQKVRALAVLALNEPCDLKIIKTRYRKLLAVHHPDKGGCASTTQSLNDAMSILKRCYSE